MDDKNPTAATVQAVPPFPTAPAPRSKRKWLRGGFMLLSLLRGAAYGANWAFIGRLKEGTHLPQVIRNAVPLTTRVNGTTNRWCLLDSTDARIALDQAEARLTHRTQP